MGPRSLAQMAQAVAIKNLDHIPHLGDLPFWAAKGILERVKHPDQLRTFEEANPILREDTAYLWHRLIERDFRRPSEKKRYTVDDPTEVWTLYYRYQREEEEEIALGLAKLKHDMKNVNQKTNTTTLMPASQAPPQPAPRLPGNSLGMERYYYSKYAGKTKGQIGFAKALRKTKQARQANRLIPQSIGFSTTRLAKAPKGMVLAHELASRPRIPPPSPFPTIKPPVKIQRTTEPSLIAREERLRRIKEGKPPEPGPGEAPAPAPTPTPARIAQPSRQPPTTGRGPRLLSFSRGINANLKITRVPARTAAHPTETNKKPSQHFEQPKAAGPATHVAPPATQRSAPRRISPPAATQKYAPCLQVPPQHAHPKRNAAPMPPNGSRKRPAAATPNFLRPMKRPKNLS